MDNQIKSTNQLFNWLRTKLNSSETNMHRLPDYDPFSSVAVNWIYFGTVFLKRDQKWVSLCLEFEDL